MMRALRAPLGHTSRSAGYHRICWTEGAGGSGRYPVFASFSLPTPPPCEFGACPLRNPKGRQVILCRCMCTSWRIRGAFAPAVRHLRVTLLICVQLRSVSKRASPHAACRTRHASRQSPRHALPCHDMTLVGLHSSCYSGTSCGSAVGDPVTSNRLSQGGWHVALAAEKTVCTE